jgi:hypothetical protein
LNTIFEQSAQKKQIESPEELYFIVDFAASIESQAFSSEQAVSAQPTVHQFEYERSLVTQIAALASLQRLLHFSGFSCRQYELLFHSYIPRMRFGDIIDQMKFTLPGLSNLK